jgi:hypothetical protein
MFKKDLLKPLLHKYRQSRMDAINKRRELDLLAINWRKLIDKQSKIKLIDSKYRVKYEEKLKERKKQYSVKELKNLFKNFV